LLVPALRWRGGETRRYSPQNSPGPRAAISMPSLLVGSALFGIGWGLGGICPGPALVNLAGVSAPIIVFVAAMLLGMFGYELWQRRGATADEASSNAVVAASDG
jgi:uncharacterized membrane protein YedE/YeeE